MNSITITGSLGKEPELAYNNSGMPVCKFSVATNHKKKNGEEETTWHNIAVFGDMAEHCAESLAKGTRVVVIGRWANRQYEKRDGTTGYANQIIADEVGVNLRFQVCDVSKPGKRGQQQQAPALDDEEPF